MPYIKQDVREDFDTTIEVILASVSNLPKSYVKGALNYIISRIVAGALQPDKGDWKYDAIADAIGTFDCAKLEFYRRIAGPKEDRAIELNGDITEYQGERGNRLGT